LGIVRKSPAAKKFMASAPFSSFVPYRALPVNILYLFENVRTVGQRLPRRRRPCLRGIQKSLKNEKALAIEGKGFLCCIMGDRKGSGWIQDSTATDGELAL
jgi:hypothetical protein